MNAEIKNTDSSHRDVRFNAIINILEGAFAGSGYGFASFITIIPLFVSQLTDSAILIGLIPAIHEVGFQLPQLLTVGKVRKLSRYKPMVLMMTLHERLPFFGLALVAYFLPRLENNTALVLVFGLLIWQGLGGGLTATVWQSMLGKIVPNTWHGRFFGAQSSASNLLASGSAIVAGQILDRFASPIDFTLCFLLAGLGFMISQGILGTVREDAHTPAQAQGDRSQTWADLKRLLKRDRGFRRFLSVRIICQVGMVATSYYAVYTVGELGVSASLVGWLTGVLIFLEMLFNPLFGYLGDRKGHRLVLFIGTIAAMISAALAGWTTSIPGWFLVFGLTGIGYVSAWTTSMVISLEFGSRADKPMYVALSNTLLAPATLVAPFLASWCIESYGYSTLFRASAAVYLIAVLWSFSLLRMGMKDKAIVGA